MFAHRQSIAFNYLSVHIMKQTMFEKIGKDARGTRGNRGTLAHK